jgi:hypothetical protein
LTVPENCALGLDTSLRCSIRTIVLRAGREAGTDASVTVMPFARQLNTAVPYGVLPDSTSTGT